MTIKVGDKIPSVTLMQMKDGGPKPVSTDELFTTVSTDDLSTTVYSLHLK